MKKRSIADDNAVPGNNTIEREPEEMHNVNNAASLLRNLEMSNMTNVNDPQNLQSHGMQRTNITSEVSPFQRHQGGINPTLDAFESSNPYYVRAHGVPTAAALTPAPSTIEQLIGAHAQQYRTPSSHFSSAPQLETMYATHHITPRVNANAIHTGTLDTRFSRLVDQTFVNTPSSFSTTETGVNTTYPTIGGTRLLPENYRELAAILPCLSAPTQRIVISSLNSSLAQQGAEPLQHHIDLNNLVYNHPTDTATQLSMPPGTNLSLLPHRGYYSAPELTGLPQLQTVQSLVYPSSIYLSSPPRFIQHRQDQTLLGTDLNRSTGEVFPPSSLETPIPKTSEDIESTRPSQRRRLNTIVEHESHQHLHVQNQDSFAPQDRQGSHGGTGSNSPSPSRHQQEQQEDPEKASEMQKDYKLRVFKSFEERFKDLLAFKERHGHCNVPRRYRLDKSLGVWCNNIRFSYKQIKEGKQPHNSLSKDDIRRLEEIGFNWKLINSKSRSRDSDESNERSANVIQKDEDRPSPGGSVGSL